MCRCAAAPGRPVVPGPGRGHHAPCVLPPRRPPGRAPPGCRAVAGDGRSGPVLSVGWADRPSARRCGLPVRPAGVPPPWPPARRPAGAHAPAPAPASAAAPEAHAVHAPICRHGGCPAALLDSPWIACVPMALPAARHRPDRLRKARHHDHPRDASPRPPACRPSVRHHLLRGRHRRRLSCALPAPTRNGLPTSRPLTLPQRSRRRHARPRHADQRPQWAHLSKTMHLGTRHSGKGLPERLCHAQQGPEPEAPRSECPRPRDLVPRHPCPARPGPARSVRAHLRPCHADGACACGPALLPVPRSGDAVPGRHRAPGWHADGPLQWHAAACAYPSPRGNRTAPRRDLLPTPRKQTACRRVRGPSHIVHCAAHGRFGPLKALS